VSQVTRIHFFKSNSATRLRFLLILPEFQFAIDTESKKFK